jgi:hypothetical protein
MFHQNCDRSARGKEGRKEVLHEEGSVRERQRRQRRATEGVDHKVDTRASNMMRSNPFFPLQVKKVESRIASMISMDTTACHQVLRIGVMKTRGEIFSFRNFSSSTILGLKLLGIRSLGY